MGFKAAVCEGCGGSIDVDESREYGYCPYCGTKYFSEKVINNTYVTNNYNGATIIQGQADVENYIKLAEQYYQDGDYEKARDTVEHALPQDPINAGLWKCMEKIEAATWIEHFSGEEKDSSGYKRVWNISKKVVSLAGENKELIDESKKIYIDSIYRNCKCYADNRKMYSEGTYTDLKDAVENIASMESENAFLWRCKEDLTSAALLNEISSSTVDEVIKRNDDEDNMAIWNCCEKVVLYAGENENLVIEAYSRYVDTVYDILFLIVNKRNDVITELNAIANEVAKKSGRGIVGDIHYKLSSSDLREVKPKIQTKYIYYFRAIFMGVILNSEIPGKAYANIWEKECMGCNRELRLFAYDNNISEEDYLGKEYTKAYKAALEREYLDDDIRDLMVANPMYLFGLARDSLPQMLMPDHLRKNGRYPEYAGGAIIYYFEQSHQGFTDENVTKLKKGLSAREKAGCYIATCVYGSYDCPPVWTLRRFRDYTLGRTWYGRCFVKCYYAISPKLVYYFGGYDLFRNSWKCFLDVFVKQLNKKGVSDTSYNDYPWN